MADEEGPPSSLSRCAPGRADRLVVVGETSYFKDGTTERFQAWQAQSPAPDAFGCSATASFDKGVGLVLEWNRQCETRFPESSRGRLLGTDAPLG